MPTWVWVFVVNQLLWLNALVQQRRHRNYWHDKYQEYRERYRLERDRRLTAEYRGRR